MAPIPVSGETPPVASPDAPWSHRRFFDALPSLGRLRVISRSGPSTFEALCSFGAYGFGHGHMNAITGAYHWHVSLEGFGHLRSRDEVHERSGRRVLFFELRERAGSAPFLFIYLHRERGEEFEPEREQRFGVLHAELSHGIALGLEEASS